MIDRSPYLELLLDSPSLTLDCGDIIEALDMISFKQIIDALATMSSGGGSKGVKTGSCMDLFIRSIIEGFKVLSLSRQQPAQDRHI